MLGDSNIVWVVIIVVFILICVALCMAWNPCPAAKCDDKKPSSCDLLNDRHPKKNSPSIFDASRDNCLTPNDVISAQCDAFETINNMYSKGLITANDSNV